MRSRLNERLARAARFPVTLIVAPAGFGKSVALRDFIQSARLEAARYDVRREHDTLPAFARGLSLALKPMAPAALASFPSMEQRAFAAEDPVREFSDWFAEHLKRTVCTVVIDDLHHAAVDPRAVGLLADLIERTSERINWIVASRTSAGLPVASWMGYGRMDLPVGEDDLRFTPDEALAVADATDTGVAAEEVDLLREFTGGWPVALAIALRTRTYATDLLSASAGTREMVYRYLAEQVYGALSEEKRSLLLGTCVFPVFDAGIVEALGGNATMLAELRRDVAFLTPVAADEYRYHDLFRDFLETELRARGERAYKAALRTAATVLEDRQDDAGALALFAKAQDGDAVTRLIERSGFALMERGRAQIVSAALEALPEESRLASAAVQGVRAMLDAARGHFDLAERGFLEAAKRSTELEVRVGILHRYAIELVRHGRECASVLGPFAGDTRVPKRLRVLLLGTLATSYAREGDASLALGTIATALSLLDADIDDDVRARIYQQAAFVHQFGPSRDETKRFANLAIETALSRNLYEIAARAYSVLYSVVFGENDDPLASLQILDRLAECARKSGSRQVLLMRSIAAYDIEVERGNDAAIEDLERELAGNETVLPGARSEGLFPANALRATWSGDFASAFDLVNDTADELTSQERRALRFSEMALYAIAAGRHAEGEPAMQAAVAALDRCSGPSRRTVRCRLFLAMAELVRGHSGAAHRYIGEAERSTVQTPRLRAFVHAVRALYGRTQGQVEAPALASALERLRSEHLGGFARLIERLPLASAGDGSFGALTSAEREILILLVKGASSKDVAAQTKRSPQTVDTHIRSICRKLNCSGRREAVALAMGAGWVHR